MATSRGGIAVLLVVAGAAAAAWADPSPEEAASAPPPDAGPSDATSADKDVEQSLKEVLAETGTPPPSTESAAAPDAEPATPEAKPVVPKAEPESPASAWEPKEMFIFGLEAGYAWTADNDQLFGNGPGHVLLLGTTHFDYRLFESYDLEDRSGKFRDIADTRGQLKLTSACYRTAFVSGRYAIRPILGLAWIRRSSLRRDEDDILVEYKMKSQHGAALMTGVGVAVRFGMVMLSLDLRFYPTWWSGIDGDRAVVRDGQVVGEPIVDSPGGMPRTLSISFSLGS